MRTCRHPCSLSLDLFREKGLEAVKSIQNGESNSDAMATAVVTTEAQRRHRREMTTARQQKRQLPATVTATAQRSNKAGESRWQQWQQILCWIQKNQWKNIRGTNKGLCTILTIFLSFLWSNDYFENLKLFIFCEATIILSTSSCFFSKQLLFWVPKVIFLAKHFSFKILNQLFTRHSHWDSSS